MQSNTDILEKQPSLKRITMNSILYWTITGLVAMVFVGSAIINLSGNTKAKGIEASLGGRSNQIILSILKLIIAALWIIPQSGLFGALLAIAYMGGAIAHHFTSKTSITAVVIIQIIIWLASVYRFPELLLRLVGN
ncbi:MAG: hypothetical protein KDC59_03180 [Saprospiraceae bacterium]|nr:DoxX family protein [Bacteroidota bacterium]MCB0670905.1 hypothetical protein [Saprospiraceae bacterium]HPG06893.1 hypothetical protein [Saprospiraceae bacterium]